MKYFLFIVVLIGILLDGWPVAALSQENSTAPQHLTLEEAKHIALENHPQIKAGDYRVDAAKESVKIVRSGYLPQVTGNAVRVFADNGTRIAATNSINDPTVIDRASAGVGLSQLITDFGRTGDLLESSKLQLTAERERTTLTRENVVLNVTRAYYNALRAQSLLRVAEDTLKTRKALLDQVSSLRDAKMKSNLDLSIAKQGQDDAKLLLLKARGGMEDTQAALTEALGASESTPFVLEDVSEITAPSGDLNALLGVALDHNPELAELKAEKEAAEKLADAEHEAGYPTVSALAFAGNTPIHDTGVIRDNYATAGINVSIPFYTGGKLTATEKKAEYKAKEAAQEWAARKNQVLRDVRTAFDNTQTAYKNIEVTRQFLQNSGDTLDLIQSRYDLGKSSIVDLNQAQLAETQAEIANTNASYEYLIQSALLEYINGN